MIVVIGQLPKLLGFSVDASGLFEEIGEIVTSIAHGDVDGGVAAAMGGIVCLLVIVAFRRWLPRIPGGSSSPWSVRSW